MFGYMMHASDNVLENLLTHIVPEADPTRAHLDTVINPGINDGMDQLKEIREYYDTGDMDKEDETLC